MLKLMLSHRCSEITNLEQIMASPLPFELPLNRRTFFIAWRFLSSSNY